MIIYRRLYSLSHFIKTEILNVLGSARSRRYTLHLQSVNCYYKADDSSLGLILDSKQLTTVNRFSYLESCVKRDRNATLVWGYTSKSQAACTGLKLSYSANLTFPVCCALRVHFCCMVPFRSCSSLGVYNHRRLRIISEIGWIDRLSDANFRNPAIGTGLENTLSAYSAQLTSFLGLRMTNTCLPHGVEATKRSTDDLVVWIKNLGANVGKSGAIRVRGRGPRDSSVC